MTHRNRILADRLVAVPVAFLFNVIARFLGAILRRDHSITPSNINRIVVAKLIGMGSILQATPLLSALKHQYPDATLTFVTMRGNQEFVNRLSNVDEVLVLDDRSLMAMAITTLQTIVTLIRLRADLYFDLEVYSAFASLLALCAMTRNRLGFYRHSTAFKNGIYTHLVYFNTRMPVRQLYLQLGRVIGVPSAQSEKTGPIRVEDADRSSVAGLLSQHSEWRSDQPYVVINPNASDLLLERRWPTQSVVETISRLVSLGHQVALIGARNELPYVKGLFDHLPSEVQARVVNTAGALTLGGMLALLDGAACVLTNDSGPMHIAVALERPTVCLFGPANPEHYGHELPNVANFYAPVFCSPCLYEADQPPCNGNNICMQRIKPEPVIQAVLRLLGASSADAQVGVHPTDLPIISDAPDGSPLGVVVRASLGRDIR